MIDWLTRTLAGSNRSQEDVPPKPDPKTVCEEHTFDIHDVTLEYQNGDTETFEAIRVRSREGQRIIFNTAPLTLKPISQLSGVPIEFETREANYNVLAREPTLDYNRTQVWELTYDVEYELDEYQSPPVWEEQIDPASVQFECVGTE